MTDGELGDFLNPKNVIAREREKDRIPPPLLPEVVATFVAA
tara:strand:- start:155 stop:277 length:123 start_codon:yes stop_codon:yes gene_type:complete